MWCLLTQIFNFDATLQIIVCVVVLSSWLQSSGNKANMYYYTTQGNGYTRQSCSCKCIQTSSSFLPSHFEARDLCSISTFT